MTCFKLETSNPEITYAVSVGEDIPDNKVVRVNLRPTAAVQQDPRVSHNGATPVMLVLHGGNSWQKTVEIF